MRASCNHHCSHMRQQETEAQRGQVTSQRWGLNLFHRLSSEQAGQKSSPDITWVWPQAL